MDFLSLEIPIFQGGMGVGVSLGGLAGAVAAQGGAGTISTAQIGFQEPDFQINPLQANLRAIGKEVQKARELAKGRGAIGVNIMHVTQHYEEYVKEAVKQKVDFIVSGAGLPMDLPALTKGSPVKMIPVVSSLKAVSVICRRWLKKNQRLPDAVLVEGPQAGGHLGFRAEEVALLEKDIFQEEIRKIISYVRRLGKEQGCYIPVIVAGGIYDYKDFCEQFDLGADFVQLGTRFVTTKECDADEAYKQAYIKCKKEDIQIIKSPVGMPGRALENAFIKQSKEQRIPPQKCYNCISVCNPKETPYCITNALIQAVKGDVENGLIFCGANAWKESQIRTVKEVINEVLFSTK